MLGTGIASADEDVNPDKPASPLDGSITVPFNLDNNALGTPLGQRNLPEITRELHIGVDDVARAVPLVDSATAPVAPMVDKARTTAAPVVTTATALAGPLADQARDQAAPLTATATPIMGTVVDTVEPVSGKLAALPGGDKLPPLPLGKLSSLPAVPDVDSLGTNLVEDNRINGDLVVPVDVSGNAVALLGEAAVANESQQSAEHSRDVNTTGADGFLAGNVVDLDYALPVQVTGNALAAGGDAVALSSATQDASATGDIVTDGGHGVLSGNAIAGQLATPVQANGNALAGLGRSIAIAEAETTATSGGTVLTSGEESVAGGNVAGVPVAAPVKANGTGLAVLGTSGALSDSVADATAGATRQGLDNVPTYLETTGHPGLLAGNVAQPALSGPVAFCGNAGAVGGTSAAGCRTTSDTVAGGTNRTSGAEAILSGGVAHAPVVLPTQGFGNAVAGLGDAEAVADNAVQAKAGGDSYSHGYESVLSGTNAVAPVTGSADLFANSVSGLGDSSATAKHLLDATAGGYTGTTGDNSIIGGNGALVPVALPVEGFGNAAGAIGTSEAIGAETKVLSSGGSGNTVDDYGIAASNLLSVPVAGAAQAFGNGAGVLADTEAAAIAENVVAAGGDVEASGRKGLLSGNLGQLPVAAPAQLFGSGASVLGDGTQVAVQEGVFAAGGDAISDGTHGALAGNVVNAPVAGAAQLFGDSVAALARNESLAGSVTATDAGGDTATSGVDGLLAGNVVSPQGLPIVQGFALAGSALGGGSAGVASNVTEAESGGDIDTSGEDGFLAGNLLDVPAAGVVQVFGDAVAVLGSRSYATALNITDGQVGGESTTEGDADSLSGIDGTLPLGVNLPVYDVPVEVLAQAITEASHNSDIVLGDGESGIDLPITGSLMPTELPSLLPMSTPVDSFRGVFSGMLPAVSEAAPAVVPETPVEYHTLPAPYPVNSTTAADPIPGLTGGNLLGGNLLGGDLPGGDLLGGGLLGGGLLGGGLLGGGLLGGGLLDGDLGGDLLRDVPLDGDLLDGDLLDGDLLDGDLLDGDLLDGDLLDGDLLGGDLLGGDLFHGLLGGLLGGVPVGDASGMVDGLPVNDLLGATGSLPAGDLGGRHHLADTDTRSANTVALPVISDLTEIATVIPVVSSVPALENSSFLTTHDALANLFTRNPIG